MCHIQEAPRRRGQGTEAQPGEADVLGACRVSRKGGEATSTEDGNSAVARGHRALQPHACSSGLSSACLSPTGSGSLRKALSVQLHYEARPSPPG